MPNAKRQLQYRKVNKDQNSGLGVVALLLSGFSRGVRVASAFVEIGVGGFAVHSQALDRGVLRFCVRFPRSRSVPVGTVHAGQLSASAFQTYDPTTASSIVPGAFALFTVPVGSIRPTQLNEGFSEVGKKTAGFDLLAPSQLQSNLLTAIEPVVIGPGGVLYLTDGHHTFTALQNSIYGGNTYRLRQRHRQLLEPDHQPVLPEDAVAEFSAAAQQRRRPRASTRPPARRSRAACRV